MCEPVSATTAAYMMIASAAISAGATIYSGYQQKEQAEYQAKMDRNNAIAAEYQAQNAAQLGEIEREELRMRNARMEASGINAYAGSGVMLGDGGSPMSWSLDFADQAARDLEMSKYNSENAVWGYNQEASNFRAQAALTESTGKNAFMTSVIKGAGTVLGAYSDYSMAAKAPPKAGTAVMTRPASASSPGYYVMRK